MPSLIQSVVCMDCSHVQATHEPLPDKCEKCGSDWLEARYDYAKAAEQWKTGLADRPASIWRYEELLPVNTKGNIVSLGEGGTFLQKCDGLAKTLGLKDLYIKNETTNPSGSFIDRGVTVLVSKALEVGVKSLS